MWLLTALKTRAGQAVAAFLAFAAWLAVDRRKQRQKGAQDTRRRAQAGAENRKESRDEINDDVRAVDANDSLRDDGWTRD